MNTGDLGFKQKIKNLRTSFIFLAGMGVSGLGSTGCGVVSKTQPPIPVNVTISPTSATVATGGTQQFTATVNTSNTAVTWQVNGVTGGNATVGTISSSGLYTAPATVQSTTTVTVTAVSQADPTKSASAQVTITPIVGMVFYVSTTGSDSNPGTLSSPWRTIQHAANSVQDRKSVV